MRLAGWDYSCDGAYFLTLCANDRKCLFSNVVGRGILDAPLVELTDCGSIVNDALLYSQAHNSDIILHKWVVMPNHVHILLSVCRSTESVWGASGKPRPTNARIPIFVSSIKRYTNRRTGFSLWQKQYFDRIVRDEQEFLRIWQYIDNNPAAWLEDDYYSV